MKRETPRSARKAHSVLGPIAPLLLICTACAGTSGGPGGLPHPATRIHDVAVDGALKLSDAFSSVAATLTPTVVFIRSEIDPRRMEHMASLRGAGMASATYSTGTGFIVRSDGYLLTNNHVVQNSRRIFAQLSDGREFQAELVGSDPVTDIAVLRIPVDGLATARMGDSEDVRVGEWVLAIGNPLGSALTFSVTAGIVSATRRPFLSKSESPVALEFIQTDAVTNPGNSGGPLVDLYGHIVGMNSMIISTTRGYQGYTLAIPSNMLLPVASELISRGRVVRSGLAVRVEDATAEDAIVAGLPSVQGVVVQDVMLGARLAERAGLRAGDVIVAVDGHEVNRTTQLQREVWFRTPGDVVDVDVRREGGAQTRIRVPLVALDDATPDAPPEADDTAAVDPCAGQPLGLCLEPVAGSEGVEADTVGVAGLLVEGVHANGPADGKLVPLTDVITHVNGQRTRCFADLRAALIGVAGGDIVAVKTYRPRTGEHGFTRLRLR